MKVSAHLVFDGDCEAAFRFYERVLGGALRLFRYGDSPGAGDGPAEWRDKIMHATLVVGDSELGGVDVPAGLRQGPSGFHLLVRPRDAAEAARVFAALSEDGGVTMPLQRTFWSPAFGVVTDRFGISWEISAPA